MAAARRPLDGVRVIDLTQVWAGPKCTQILAYLGAEVIKVESPHRADQLRGTRTEQADQTVGDRPYDRKPGFNSLNRRKLGITLDLRKEAGLNLLKRLLALSDVVVENFSVGVMDRLGLGYEVLRAIKPDVIVLSMPGFGMSGPERGYISWAPTIEAMSGMMHLTGYQGDRPMKEGIALPDPLAGVFGAAAVLTALMDRARTGNGRFVELAQQEALLSFSAAPIIDWELNRRIPPLRGNRHDGAAPQGVYPCRETDTWIAITVRDNDEWECLRIAMGDPAWAQRFADAASRIRASEELDRHIAEYTRGFDAVELARDLQAGGVAAGVAATAGQLNRDLHLSARGMFETVGHDLVGPHQYFMPLGVKFSRTDLSPARGAPTFGQDNHAVLAGLLGLSAVEIDALERDQVIGSVPTG